MAAVVVAGGDDDHGCWVHLYALHSPHGYETQKSPFGGVALARDHSHQFL